MKHVSTLPGSYVLLVCADDMVEFEADTAAICMEDRLRSLGILSKADDLTINSTLNSATFKSIDLQTNMPQKKVCLLVIYLHLYGGLMLYFLYYYLHFLISPSFNYVLIKYLSSIR